MPIKIPGKNAETKKSATQEVAVQNTPGVEEKYFEGTANEPQASGTSGGAKDQLMSKQGKATISQQNNKTKVEKVTEEAVGVPLVTSNEPMAMVTVEMSMTVNLGNYNSAKLGVQLAMPSGMKEINSTYEGARIWVEDKVSELVAAVKEED